MKITTTETTVTTTIEADARELRESNTLAGNMSLMLSRVFQNKEPLDDEVEDDDEVDEDDN